jgi:tetratricopeptide (TPR) repeat protein
MVERGPEFAAAGRLEAMARWLEVVPRPYADAVPWLGFWRGVSGFLADPPRAVSSIEAAFDAFSRAGDAIGTWLSWSAAIDLRVRALDDFAPLGRLLDALPELRARLPFPDPATEAGVVGAALAGYGNTRARSPSVREWEDRALEIALAPVDPRVRMDVGRQLLLKCGYWGTDLVRARVVLEALGPIVSAPGADPMHALVWHVGEANYHAHLGDAKSALEAADRGLAVADRSGIHVWDSLLLSVRIYGALADEDYAAASRDLRTLARAAAGGRLATASYHYTAATIALRRGDLREAVERARVAARLAEQTGHPLAHAAAHVVWAAAASRSGLEGPTLEEAAGLARASGYDLAQMGAGMLAAGAALAKGSERDAETSLRGAFEISRRTGALNSVYVPRAVLAELCAFALERGIEPDLAERIVRARRLAPGPRARGVPAWPWVVRISALGGLSIRRDGRTPADGKAQRKPLELLGLLVAYGERGASLERLAEALWPDADGDTAHHALETTMYRLRRMLGDPAAVVRHAGRASLDPARVHVDAWAVDALAARAEALHARGNLAEALRAAAAAADMYRGDLLADSDEPAIGAPRARLRARLERLSALRAPLTRG